LLELSFLFAVVGAGTKTKQNDPWHWRLQGLFLKNLTLDRLLLHSHTVAVGFYSHPALSSFRTVAFDDDDDNDETLKDE
jgi:hypothetical protein